jgi:hypothetical protein
MMLASHTPPHIRPPLETVARLVLLLVKEMSAATVVPEAFRATADIAVTAPSLREIEVGVNTREVTLLELGVPLPPHPGRKTRNRRAAMAAKPRTDETRCM